MKLVGNEAPLLFGAPQVRQCLTSSYYSQQTLGNLVELQLIAARRYHVLVSLYLEMGIDVSLPLDSIYMTSRSSPNHHVSGTSWQAVSFRGVYMYNIVWHQQLKPNQTNSPNNPNKKNQNLVTPVSFRLALRMCHGALKCMTRPWILHPSR